MAVGAFDAVASAEERGDADDARILAFGAAVHHARMSGFLLCGA